MRKQVRQQLAVEADALLSFPLSWQKGRHCPKMPCETLRTFHEIRPAVFLSAQSSPADPHPLLFAIGPPSWGSNNSGTPYHTSRVIEQKVGSHQIRLNVKAVKKTSYHETKCAWQQSLFPSSRLAITCPAQSYLCYSRHEVRPIFPYPTPSLLEYIDDVTQPC